MTKTWVRPEVVIVASGETIELDCWLTYYRRVPEVRWIGERASCTCGWSALSEADSDASPDDDEHRQFLEDQAWDAADHHRATAHADAVPLTWASLTASLQP